MPSSSKAHHLLERAIEHGLTFDEVVSIFSKRQSDAYAPLVRAARATHQEAGAVEIDDDAIASTGSPDADGCYVQAWVWVDFDQLTEDEQVALRSTLRLSWEPHYLARNALTRKFWDGIGFNVSPAQRHEAKAIDGLTLAALKFTFENVESIRADQPA